MHAPRFKAGKLASMGHVARFWVWRSLSVLYLGAPLPTITALGPDGSRWQA